MLNSTHNKDPKPKAEIDQPPELSLTDKLQQDNEELTAEIETLRDALADCEITNVERRRVTTRKGRLSLPEFNGRITKVLHG